MKSRRMQSQLNENQISSKEVYSCSLFWVTEDEAEDRTGWKIKRSVVRIADRP